MRARGRLGAALAALGIASLGAALGCNGILGIETAQVDPALVGDAGADGAVDAGTDDPVCVEYCATVDDACKGAGTEYIDTRSCLNICRSFDIGSAGDTNGNTLNCRLTNARLAKTQPDKFCRAAGPLSVGACAAVPSGQTDPEVRCKQFCNLVDSLCRDFPPYTDINDCNASCLTYLVTDGVEVRDSNGFVTSGNTLNCRLYHLEAANQATGPVELHAANKTHCPHTAKSSATCN